METRHAVEAVLRRWWLVMALPLAVLVGTLASSASQPYVATVRATVLLPGDTEMTGDAERPELMVMDDAPSVIRSTAFARLVAAELPRGLPNGWIDAAQVQAALSADRYSRVLTIEARRDDAREALAIARAVQAVLPNAVNQYLVEAGGQQATVQIIDPPGQPVRDGEDRAVVLTVQTLVALAAGLGLAALAATLDERLYAVHDVEETLGVPVLADVRARHGRFGPNPGSMLTRLPRWRR